MKKIDYEHHYKDRDPQETVAIVKQFFADNGYIIKKVINRQTNSTSWCMRIELFLDGSFICGANGKGVTYDYCEASAHAELYERFCNICGIGQNAFFHGTYDSKKFAQCGYLFDKNEKSLTEQEALDAVDLHNFFDPIPQKIKSYIYGTIIENNFIGVPYRSISNQPDKFYDWRLLNLAITSNGMCAGNTLEEALVQGISELCERSVTEQFLFNPQEKYYAVNKKSIHNPTLLNMMKSIEENDGLDITIIDLSYNFNLPTVMVMMTNQQEVNTFVGFGSHPVFDIALERTITELYQPGEINTHPQWPIKDPQIIFKLSQSWGELDAVNCYVDQMIGKIKEVDMPNWDVFLSGSGNFSNDELLNYYRDLEKKTGFYFYYRDNSKSDKIYAAQVMCPQMNANEIFKRYIVDLFQRYDEETLDLFFKLYLTSYNLILDYFNDCLYFDSLAIYKELFGELQKFLHQNDHIEFALFLMSDTYSLYGNHETVFWELQEELLINNILDLRYVEHLRGTIFYTPYKKYYTLRYYIMTEQYSDDQLKQIFEQLKNPITDKDLTHIYDPNYLFIKIALEPLKKEFETTYQKYIDTLIKEDKK